ncbi:hypothetical protein EDC04DRAFT_1287482 [Pisolithus marmoratus]|nr:hypothetical protein EDC04DRAFT_1287482 [Pisolithus marmoratus]
MLRCILPGVPRHEVHVIPGSTHPSFSDVFLILPDYVNKMMGLAIDPLYVINATVDKTKQFLENGGEYVNSAQERQSDSVQNPLVLGTTTKCMYSRLQP